MPKEVTKRSLYNELNATPSKRHSENLHLEIEHLSKKEEPKPPLSWPAHVLVFGSTMAGKTTLISDILDNIELVYDFKNSHSKGKLIVISPIQTLEIADKLSTFSSWDIELYHNIELNEEFEEHLIKQFNRVPQNKVKILLLDDILTQSTHTQIIFLNRMFAYLRHEDISIIASVHAYDSDFQKNCVINWFIRSFDDPLVNLTERVEKGAFFLFKANSLYPLLSSNSLCTLVYNYISVDNVI